MRISLVISLFSLFGATVHCQNLVKNPGFEKYWYCPPATKVDTFPSKFWKSPNAGTPDYFHDCSRTKAFGVPNNYSGKYSSRNGKAYFGIVPIAIKSLSMEHIQGELKDSLEKGKRYRASFWVKPAFQGTHFFTDNIGMFLSEERILVDTFQFKSIDRYHDQIRLEYKAQVQNKKGDYLSDTSWQKISGIFEAKGGEKYITIGMFWEDDPRVVKAWEDHQKENTDRNKNKLWRRMKRKVLKKNREYELTHVGDCKGDQCPEFAYYLIDDVSVVPLEEGSFSISPDG